MIEHCKSVYPNEACGLLAGIAQRAEKMYAVTNTEHSSVSYLMEPAEQFRIMKELRNEGRDMVAIYHSHPHSLPYPSEKDISLAFYPDSVYLILGFEDKDHPEVKAFMIGDGNVAEIMIDYSVDALSKDDLK